MSMIRPLELMATLALLFICSGCRSARESAMVGESVVLADQSPAYIWCRDITRGSVAVRDNYHGGSVYVEDQDFIVDYKNGAISRTPNSRIPDYRSHVLYGLDRFDHGKFEGYGNSRFYVWVDYKSRTQPTIPTISHQSSLRSLREKLDSRRAVRMIAYGDSITAGRSATEPQWQFANRFETFLERRFGSEVELVNSATLGDTTAQGLERLEEKVIQQSPDLVLLAFGMNDHNAQGGVSVGQFKENLRTMVDTIRDRTHADIILLSSCPPNPAWQTSSNRMEEYARATREVAEDCSVAYAPVYELYADVLKRKNIQSLLANNLNHPNNWGHWLYFQALRAVPL